MAKQLLWVDVDAFWDAMIKAPLTAKYALPILDALELSQGNQADRFQERSPIHATPCSDSRKQVST
ncbi:MAG: hypothetical protein ABSA78_13500 [Candidatus Sulfotelmatobacter sp.]|jgi:hypothetical protein